MTTTMPAPSGEVTRERVLRLADTLFAQHGYAAVSMRALANAAGVTKPALYYHFRDKEALFEECILVDLARLGRLLRGIASDGGSLHARVARVAEVLLSGTAHHPVRIQADVSEHLPDEARRRIAAQWREQVMSPVVDLFEAAAAGGQLRSTLRPGDAAWALFGVCMSFWRQSPSPELAVRDGSHAGDARSADEIVRTVADLVVSGVGRS